MRTTAAPTVAAWIAALAAMTAVCPAQDAPSADRPDPVELVGLAAFAEAHAELVPDRFVKGFAQKLAEAEHPFPSAVLGLTLMHGSRAEALGVKKGRMKPEQWRAFEAEVRAETMPRFAAGLAVPFVTGRSLELEELYGVAPASIATAWERAAEALPRARAKAERAEHLRFVEAWARSLVRVERAEHFDDAVARIGDLVDDLDLAIKLPRKLSDELAELRTERAEARAALGEAPAVGAAATAQGLQARGWLGDDLPLDKLHRIRPAWNGTLAVAPGQKTLEIQWPWSERPDPLASKRCVVVADGWMRVPGPGLYRLVVAFDDFAQVSIGGEVVIDAWSEARGAPIVGTFYALPLWLEEDTPISIAVADRGAKLAISLGLNRVENGSWQEVPLELCHAAGDDRR